MPNKSDLLAQYKQLAKVANQRLLRIEQRAAKGDTRALDYAYRVAQKDIKDVRGIGKNRYNTVVPKNASIAQIQARIADVEKFINMPTSTATGLKSIDQQRVDTLNAEYGTNLTVSDMTRLSQSGVLDKLKQDYGSHQLFKALGVIKRTKKSLKTFFENNVDEIPVEEFYGKSQDLMVIDMVNDMLKNEDYREQLLEQIR